jgi:hypothetical protein
MWDDDIMEAKDSTRCCDFNRRHRHENYRRENETMMNIDSESTTSGVRKISRELKESTPSGEGEEIFYEKGSNLFKELLGHGRTHEQRAMNEGGELRNLE